jgi:hypothetical protein
VSGLFSIATSDSLTIEHCATANNFTVINNVGQYKQCGGGFAIPVFSGPNVGFQDSNGNPACSVP